MTFKLHREKIRNVHKYFYRASVLNLINVSSLKTCCQPNRRVCASTVAPNVQCKVEVEDDRIMEVFIILLFIYYLILHIHF